MTLARFLLTHRAEVVALLLRHVLLVGVSTIVAAV